MAAPGPGSVIDGKYRIDGEIAAGGAGVVLRATQLQLDRPVAIKFLLPGARERGTVVERFEREARIAAKIRSAHAVRVHDVGVVHGVGPYMVMEYLEGCDLGQRIERGEALAPAEAVDIVLQTCDALAEAHGLEIVHRDIKPKNLFLTGTPPVVKVIDFGISKVAPRRGDDGTWTVTTGDDLGTPAYMAPEQLQGVSVDWAVDIWSLGVVLHELVTGALPFRGETMPEMCTSILTEEPTRVRELRPDLPAELEEAVLRCLRKDPRARFASCIDLARALAPLGPPGSVEKVERMAAPVHGDPETPIEPAPLPESLPESLSESLPEPVPEPLPEPPDPRRTAPTVSVRPQRGAVTRPRPTLLHAALACLATAIAVASLAFTLAPAGRTHAAPAPAPAPDPSGAEPAAPEQLAVPPGSSVVRPAEPQANDPPNPPSRAPPRRPRPRAAPTTTDRRAGFGERK